MPDWSLIARYIKQENLSHTEKESVERWISESEANAREFARMKQVLRPGTPTVDFRDTQHTDWQKILSTPTSGNPAQPAGKQLSFTLLKIAASIMLVCLAGWVVMTNNFFSNDQLLFTAVDSVRQVTLADGSTVWLNKNSSLLLHDDFGKSNRKVALTGEGYFQVARDTTNKFTVSSGQIQTQVLGTTFNILNEQNGNVVVTVQEGKVAVSTADLEIKLIKDESAVYRKEQKQLSKNGPNQDVNYLSWKTGIIRFNTTPLDEVCIVLSEHYGITVTADKNARDYEITSVLDNLTVDQALEIITETLDLEVDKKKNTIVLSAKR